MGWLLRNLGIGLVAMALLMSGVTYAQRFEPLVTPSAKPFKRASPSTGKEVLRQKIGGKIQAKKQQQIMQTRSNRVDINTREAKIDKLSTRIKNSNAVAIVKGAPKKVITKMAAGYKKASVLNKLNRGAKAPAPVRRK